MGLRFRKSVKLPGGFRVNFSKSGVGYSWGVKGYRKTKMANGRTRTTYSIPGTGISYVEETGKDKQTAATQDRSDHTTASSPTWDPTISGSKELGLSLGAFAGLMVLGVILAVAGLLVMLKVSWWGLALVAAGIGVLMVTEKKV